MCAGSGPVCVGVEESPGNGAEFVVDVFVAAPIISSA